MLPIYSYVNDQLGPLSGVCLVPAPDVNPRPARYHKQSEDSAEQKVPERSLGNCRPDIAGGKEKEAGSGDCSGHYHRVQPDKSSFEEACQTHPVPSVIVSISDDESREHEEKINRKIAVVDDLICGAA